MVQTATAATAAPENPTAIFDTAIALFIQSGERLLELFDKLSKPEQQANEVLKRAALVMILTVWEIVAKSTETPKTGSTARQSCRRLDTGKLTC